VKILVEIWMQLKGEGGILLCNRKKIWWVPSDSYKIFTYISQSLRSLELLECVASLAVYVAILSVARVVWFYVLELLLCVLEEIG